jgi:outer membrane protein OmpA-like peptidoglycan-associated protein
MSLIVVIFIIGCGHWDKTNQSNRFEQAELQNRLQHMRFDLEILSLRGARLCIPGQLLKLEDIYTKTEQAYYAKMYDDIDYIEMDFKKQRDRMLYQLKWIDLNTQCLLVQQSPNALKERTELLLAIDNQFAENSTELLPEYQNALLAVAKILQNQTTWRLTLTGYTDNLGERQANQMLGLERAERVEKFLVELGVPTKQILAISAGEDESAGDTPTHRLADRKVIAKIQIQTEPEAGERVHAIRDWDHGL